MGNLNRTLLEDLEKHPAHTLVVRKRGKSTIIICAQDGEILLVRKPPQDSSSCCPTCEMVFKNEGTSSRRTKVFRS